MAPNVVEQARHIAPAAQQAKLQEHRAPLRVGSVGLADARRSDRGVTLATQAR